jgi:hypothetical protein
MPNLHPFLGPPLLTDATTAHRSTSFTGHRLPQVNRQGILQDTLLVLFVNTKQATLPRHATTAAQGLHSTSQTLVEEMSAEVCTWPLQLGACDQVSPPGQPGTAVPPPI